MSQFGYVNARLRAMRSDFLSRDVLEELLELHSLKEFSDWMVSGAYGPAFGKAPDHDHGIATVDWVISERLRDTLARCIRMVSIDRESPLSVYLTWVGYENVKVLARSILPGVCCSNTNPALVHIPPFDTRLVEQLCGATDLEGLATLLMTAGHPSGVALRRFLREEAKTPEAPRLDYLDRAMERAYLESALAHCQGRGPYLRPLRRAIKDEIDLSNLRSALKVTYSGGGPFPHRPLQGGRIGKRVLEDISSASSLEAALPLLKRTVFRKALGQGARRAARANNPGNLERTLERVRYQRMSQDAIEDPTGLGFTLHFLTEVWTEAQNLRLVARAVSGLISVQAAKEAMVLV